MLGCARRISHHLRYRTSQLLHLTFPPGQARIADAWISSSQMEDWIEFYALAVKQACGRRGVNEVTAAADSDMALAALEKCGFRIRGRDPVPALRSAKAECRRIFR